MRPLVLFILYLSVTLLPLALAWLGARPPRTVPDELASGAGMLAFAIILVEFVLSGRFRKISARIGMDVTMRMHQLFARSALALAIVHPFLYRTAFNPQLPWDETRHLSLTADLTALWTGILAWILLPVLVLLSIGRDKIVYTYETWRAIHGLGALLIAGLILHHTLDAGRYSQDPLLAGIWLSLFALAALSLAYVYGFEPIIQKRRPWSVRSVRPVALKTWELTVDPDGHQGIKYEAGQFAWLNVGNSPFSLHENPFSICSAPGSGSAVQFMIKELGDFTNIIGEIKPGTTAYLDAPHGTLSVSGRTEPGVCLIGGGVGIAPLLGILRQLRHDNDKRATTLVYGNRIEEQIAYRQELEELTHDHGTNVVLALYEPPENWQGHAGMADATLIRSIFKSPQMTQWLFVLCGPPIMMEIAEDTLIELGVPAHQILSERFVYD